MKGIEVSGTQATIAALGLAAANLAPITTAIVEAVAKRVRKLPPQSVAELIDRECEKRKSGWVGAGLKKTRKDPVLAKVSYVPMKGKRQGMRGEFVMVACGKYDHGRTCLLKPIDDNGNVLDNVLYKVRESKDDENFGSLQLI